MTTYNDNDDYGVEIDVDLYNQDFDDVNPDIIEEEKTETDIQFE